VAYLLLVRPLKTLLLLVFLATTAIGAPLVISRADIVGTWKDMMFLPYDGAYEFHADGSFSAYWEDQVDAGKWIFHPPAKIELISYSDYLARRYSGKSHHEFIQIERLIRGTMYVRRAGRRGALVKR